MLSHSLNYFLTNYPTWFTKKFLETYDFFLVLLLLLLILIFNILILDSSTTTIIFSHRFVLPRESCGHFFLRRYSFCRIFLRLLQCCCVMEKEEIDCRHCCFFFFVGLVPVEGMKCRNRRFYWVLYSFFVVAVESLSPSGTKWGISNRQSRPER